MTEKRWKAQERRMARLLNCKRNPNTGASQPDMENAHLAVDNKDRKELPKWIVEALVKVQGLAQPNRLGMVTVSSPNDPLVLVVMSLEDYRTWYIGTPKAGKR